MEPDSRPLRIFLVENHPDTAKWLGMYLELLGHTVVMAENVHDALEGLASAEYDVLLCDIGLPDGDGWELLSRAHLPSTVYAIAMSGFGMTEHRLKSKAAGFRRHMLKPFEIDELHGYLREAAAQVAA